MTPGRGEGFALVAALMAVLAFAAIAFQLTAQGLGTTAVAQAELDRARLEAAASAGLALAIDGLAREPGAGRWEIDGRARPLMFDQVPLTITVEDERGKIPLNLITESETRRMFEAAGVSGTQVPVLTDSFLDWRDEDDDARLNGAERGAYRLYRPRNGALRSVDELALIRGVTPALYAALAPACTVFFGESGGFSMRNAQPIALAVMAAESANSPAVVERRRELAGERPRMDRPVIESYRGRAVTVRVEARGARQSRLTRAWIVELTGAKAQPFWVRARL